MNNIEDIGKLCDSIKKSSLKPNSHNYIGQIQGFSMFLFSGCVCISHPEWEYIDARALHEYLSGKDLMFYLLEGSPHAVDYQDHYFHSFGMSEEKRSPCVIVGGDWKRIQRISPKMIEGYLAELGSELSIYRSSR